MATCDIHKGKFAEKEVCGRCKSCKCESYFSVDEWYQCTNCYRKVRIKPDKPISELKGSEWHQVQ